MRALCWHAPNDVRIETVPGLGVDAAPAQLLALVWDLELQNTVLCTHGEGIGLLLTRLLTGALVAEDALFLWQWAELGTRVYAHA